MFADRPTVRVVFLFIAATAAAPVALADPPRVVKAVPDNGDADVDPGLREMRIEFDQDMSAGGHSICGGGPEYPEIVGRPRWESPRVMVIPVKLKPSHGYSLSINCPAAQNFRGVDGTPAEMYPISFRTASRRGGTSPKVTRDENQAAIAALRRAIDEHYSYRDLRRVDWNKAFAEYAPKLEKAETAAEFGRQAAKLLAKARDIHILVRVGETPIASHRRSVRPNCELPCLERTVPGWRQRSKCVFTGRFDDGIGYIMITTWAPESPADLEPAFEALAEFADAPGMIVDVRPNAGGDELLAQSFAGCFVEKAAVYSRNVYRDTSAPDGFTKPFDRVIEPKKGRPAFHKPVAVLMGKANMSSCESFLLMMKQAPKSVLIGETSYGSSGNPKPHDLGNGVTVLLPSWKDMAPDGTLIEGVGIRPDVNIEATLVELRRDDPLLAEALKRLRKP
ncbi:MAG: hypothetical protein HUU22_07970 [Phycisphaerae bacterium]|nr:S41 family peptidase [Phycisphaerae bacterium]NUQ45954.1 hypothetical protein [Phycisphaerae bacterium]